MDPVNETGYWLSPAGMQNLHNLINYLQTGRPQLIKPGEPVKMETAKILVEGVLANTTDVDLP